MILVYRTDRLLSIHLISNYFFHPRGFEPGTENLKSKCMVWSMVLKF